MIAACGLITLHTWLFLEALAIDRAGTPSPGLTRLALWTFWLSTLGLSLIALLPLGDE